MRIARRAILVEVGDARERVDRAVPRVHHDRGAGVRIRMAGAVGEDDAVPDRPLGRALHASIDRQLQTTGAAPNREIPKRADDLPACVDGDAGLAEAGIEDAVVRRFDAGLPDDLAGPRSGVAPLVQLSRAHLSEEPQELAAEPA